MKRNLFFLCAIIILTLALSPHKYEVPKNSAFFSTYYSRYYSWFSENIFSWEAHLSKSDFKILKDSIQKTDHWKEDQYNFQILFGIGYNKKEDKVFYTLEIYKKNIKVRWSTLDHSKCTYASQTWKCFRENKYLFNIRQDSIEKKFNSFFLRRYTLGEKEAGFFEYSNNIEYLLLPQKLQLLAKKHGKELLLPIDKISVDKQQGTILYYP